MTQPTLLTLQEFLPRQFDGINSSVALTHIILGHYSHRYKVAAIIHFVTKYNEGYIMDCTQARAELWNTRFPTIGQSHLYQSANYNKWVQEVILSRGYLLIKKENLYFGPTKIVDCEKVFKIPKQLNLVDECAMRVFRNFIAKSIRDLSINFCQPHILTYEFNLKYKSGNEIIPMSFFIPRYMRKSESNHFVVGCTNCFCVQCFMNLGADLVKSFTYNGKEWNERTVFEFWIAFNVAYAKIKKVRQEIDDDDEVEVLEEQMFTPFDVKSLGIVNLLIESEKDRKVCQSLLSKVPLSEHDVLNYKQPDVKKFIELCEAHNVGIKANVIGRDQRDDLIKQVSQLKIVKSKKFTPEDYVIQNWLKIDDFIEDLNSMNKGEQHKICKKVISLLNDKWVPTFYHNTNRACSMLIKKFKKLNIESNIRTMDKFNKKLKYYYNVMAMDKSHKEFLEEYEDQMFRLVNDVRESVTSVKTAAVDLHENIPMFRRTMVVMQNAAFKSEQLMDKMMNIFGSFQRAGDFMSVFISLLKFISFGYLVSQTPNHTVANLTALITLILPTGVGDLTLLSSLSRAVMGIIDYYTNPTRITNIYTDQGNESLFVDINNINMNFCKSFLETVGIIFKSFFTTLDPKIFGKLRANAFYFRTISDFLRSCTTITDFLIKAISTTVDFIMKHIMEYYGSLPGFLKDDDFEKIIDEYLDLKKNDALLKCGEKLKDAKRVQVLRDKLVELEANMNKNVLRDKTLSYKVAPYVRIMCAEVEKAYNLIPPMYKGIENAHRVQPYFIMLSGKPRIGKSKIFQPYLVNYLAKKLGIIQEYQDPQHYCCFRVAGREFWDGGQDKEVIWYNDLFQMFMNEQQIDMAIEELTNVVDDNPYHMNMSDVNDKSRHYLQAKLVVANCQGDITKAQWLNMRSWSGGEHLARRRAMNLVVDINPRWQTNEGFLDKRKVAAFVETNPAQCVGVDGYKMFPKDLYHIRFLDVVDGRELFVKNFEESIKYIGEDAEKYFKHQDILTTRLRYNMEKVWDQMWQPRTTNEMYASPVQEEEIVLRDMIGEHYDQVPLGRDLEETFANWHNFINTYEQIDEDQFHDAIEEFVRPARRPPLEYCPKPMSRSERILKDANYAAYMRALEMQYRQSTYFRPQRSGIYDEKTGEYIGEDVYPDNTEHIRNGGCDGSFYTFVLANIACTYVANYMAAVLTGACTTFCVKKLCYVLGCVNEAFWKWMVKVLSANQLLVVACIAVFAEVGLVVTAGALMWFGFYKFIFPYCHMIVQSTIARSIHRVFVSIEDIIVFGFQSCGYYYENFIDYCYNMRDTIIHQYYYSRDYLKYIYYKTLEIYAKIVNDRDLYKNMFKEKANKAWKETNDYIRDRLNSIPGWVYFVAGASLLSISAYMIYQYFKKEDGIKEQSHEGNMKAARRRVARKLAKKNIRTQPVDAHAYDNTNKDIENILRNSYAFIQMEAKVDDVWITIPLMGMSLNFKANLFVMPYHYWFRFKYAHELYDQNNIPNRLVLSWSIKEKSTIYFDMIQDCRLEYGHASDLLYFRIKKFTCGRDLTRFFHSEMDDVNFVDAYLFGYRPRGACDFSTTELVHLGNVHVIDKEYSFKPVTEPILHEIIPSETVYYESCYHYTDCLTGPGDCAMVLMNTDKKIGKCCGMHTAGNINCHTGLAAIIYKEDLEEVSEYFQNLDNEPVFEIQPISEFVDMSIEKDAKANEYEAEGFVVVGMTGFTNINGKQRRLCASLPSKSKIQPSLFYDVMEDDFGPALSKPAHLNPVMVDGVKVSPFDKAFAKMNKYTNCISNKMHDDIVQHCSETIRSWPSKWNKNNARLLTWDECINGYMDLKPLDLTTSSGFPFTMTNAIKKSWFYHENDKWYMKDELKNTVLRFENDLKNKKIPDIVFVDTLKDETRPNEKVDQVKTRLFQVGNMAWTILFRKYFGWFVGHCQTTSEFGEMMVGLNALGYSWDLIARKMMAMGTKHDNGDYANYDASLGHQGCTGMADCANDFYNDVEVDEIANIVRMGLLLGSINTFHLLYKCVLLRRQGNPSGFLLTTIINCFMNMYLNRYAFCILTGLSLREYLKKLYSIFYGDDKDVTVSDDIVDLFNMKTYQQVMKDLGLEYTSADKKEIVKPLLEIEEISFLKRTFWFDNDMKIWRSRLNKDTIMEICRWSESDPRNIVDQTARVNATLLELANWSRKEFEMVRTKMVGYMLALRKQGYDFDTNKIFDFEYCMHIMYPRHFPSTKLYLDLVYFGKQQNNAVLNAGAERDLGKLLNYIPQYDDEHLWEEQQYIANTLTSEELNVIKQRMLKKILVASITYTPLIKEAINKMAKTVAEICDCTATEQVCGLVSDMVYSGELFQVLQQPLKTIPEEVEPQGIDDDKKPEDTTTNNLEGITTFVDVNAVHENEDFHPGSVVAMHVMNQTDINTFITRPYEVANITWASTHTRGTMLSTLEFPYVLTNITALKNKLMNMAFWAPDIEIEIRMNATIFHYGCIGLYWIPQAKSLPATYKGYLAGMNSKHWYNVLPQSRQVVKFTVPYTHYKNQIALGKEIVGTGNIREDLFTLYMCVMWPLSSANGTPASVDVMVYARIVEPRLNGQTLDVYVPQGLDSVGASIMRKQGWVDGQGLGKNLQGNPLPVTLDSQNDRRGLGYKRQVFKQPIPTIYKRNVGFRAYREQGIPAEAQAQTKKGVVSSGILRVADFIGKFTPIPYIGAVAAPISAITATAGYFAKWMGFSVTNNMESTSPMQIRFPQLMKSEDMPVSVALCQNDGVVAKDFNYVNSFPDEMSIKNFVGSPGLIWVGHVTTAYSAGQILATFPISPRELYYRDAWSAPGGTGTIDYQPTYTHIASKFAYGWRGSMIYDICFISTQFHSCRVAAVYLPYSSSGVTLTNFTNAPSIVMDIQSSVHYRIAIPFNQRTEYLTMTRNQRDTPSTVSLTENNGTLVLMLLNKLTSVASTVTPIGYFVYAQPGPDFQMIGIAGDKMKNVNQYKPQGIDDVGPCDYPFSSIGCLQNTEAMILGGNGKGYTVDRVHHPFELTSLKQLVNQVTFYFRRTLPQATGVCIASTDVIPQATFATTDNFWVQVKQLFRYWRGGWRVVVSFPGNKDASVQAFNVITMERSPPYVTDTNVAARLPDQPTETVHGSNYITSSIQKAPLDLTIPWLSVYKCNPEHGVWNYSWGTSGIPFMAENLCCLMPEGTAGEIMHIYVGGADDWLSGWILPPPASTWEGTPLLAQSAQSASATEQETSSMNAGTTEQGVEPQKLKSTKKQYNVQRTEAGGYRVVNEQGKEVNTQGEVQMTTDLQRRKRSVEDDDEIDDEIEEMIDYQII